MLSSAAGKKVAPEKPGLLLQVAFSYARMLARKLQPQRTRQLSHENFIFVRFHASEVMVHVQN